MLLERHTISSFRLIDLVEKRAPNRTPMRHSMLPACLVLATLNLSCSHCDCPDRVDEQRWTIWRIAADEILDLTLTRPLDGTDAWGGTWTAWLTVGDSDPAEGFTGGGDLPPETWERLDPWGDPRVLDELLADPGVMPGWGCLDHLEPYRGVTHVLGIFAPPDLESAENWRYFDACVRVDSSTHPETQAFIAALEAVSAEIREAVIRDGQPFRGP